MHEQMMSGNPAMARMHERMHEFPTRPSREAGLSSKESL